jgi:tetratricopeptide (TPR) repeat protein
MAAMKRALIVLSLSIASTAFAQQGQRVPPAAEPPAADAYSVRVQAGIQQLMSGDSRNAINTFREATAMNGGRPEAHYYIGAAQRLAGDLEDAIATFRQAASAAQSANQPRWQARALHGIASTLERLEGRIEEARTAWQEYTRFADGHSQVSDTAVGRARVQAIDVMNEQEQVYVTVRQRIAEREEERRREEREGGQRRRGQR